jgi:soluble lytic murein transglycosylase-like protein
MGIFFNQNDKTKGWAAKRRLSQALMADAARQKTYRSPLEGIGELAEFYVGHKKGKEADAEERADIAAKEAQEKANQQAKIQALSAAFSAGDRDQVTQALMSNPDTADYGFKMKMQGFDQKSKMDMLRQELSMRGDAARNNVIAPNAVREFEYFNGLGKDQQEKYLNMKRSNRMYDMGGGYQRFDSNGKPQDYYQKTVKQEDQAGFKANVAQQTTAATESEKNRQEWLKTQPEQANKLEKMQSGLKSMQDNVTEAKAMLSDMTTGLAGGLLSNLPESDAGILKQRLDQIAAIVTNDIVANMSGTQTDDDAARHAKTLGTLSTSSDAKEIARALDNVASDMQKAYERDYNQFNAQLEMYSKPQQATTSIDVEKGIQPYYGKTKLQPTKYDGLLKELADNAGVPWDLARAVSYAESAGNPSARSRVGAKGLMQVMPDTLKDAGYGVSPAKNGSIRETTRVGMDYLGAMLKEYNGDVDKALAAYNAGVGTVRKYGGVPPYKETQKYIGRIKGYMTPQGQSGIQKAPAPTVSRPQQMVVDPAHFTPVSQPVSPVTTAPDPIHPAQPKASFDVNAAISQLAKKDPNINMHNVTQTAKKHGLTVEEVLRRMGYK